MVWDKIKSERKCSGCNDGDSGEDGLRCEDAQFIHTLKFSVLYCTVLYCTVRVWQTGCVNVVWRSDEEQEKEDARTSEILIRMFVLDAACPSCAAIPYLCRPLLNF